MAISVIYDFEGATLDQYDQVLEKMGLTKGGQAAPGTISHRVAKTDSGIRVLASEHTRGVLGERS